SGRSASGRCGAARAARVPPDWPRHAVLPAPPAEPAARGTGSAGRRPAGRWRHLRGLRGAGAGLSGPAPATARHARRGLPAHPAPGLWPHTYLAETGALAGFFRGRDDKPLLTLIF